MNNALAEHKSKAILANFALHVPNYNHPINLSDVSSFNLTPEMKRLAVVVERSVALCEENRETQYFRFTGLTPRG